YRSLLISCPRPSHIPLLCLCFSPRPVLSLFFYPHPPPPAFYTLSLHDALPICPLTARIESRMGSTSSRWYGRRQSSRSSGSAAADRKSTRLNSSHQIISYAVFCLKKKKKKKQNK